MLTKIMPPRLAGVMPRCRLCDLIDRADGRILWVSAPAGAGKTTMAVEYVAFRNVPCLWYQMDSGDEEPATFFHYMRLALKRVRPRLRHLPPLLTTEYLGDLELFTRRYFEKLFTLLCKDKKSPSRPGVMVLDDFQNLNDSTIHDLLRVGLSTVPDTMNVLVLSREAPPACFARLRAVNVMSVLDGEKLLFSETETGAFFDMQPYSNRLSGDSIRLVHDKTQGWAAGVRLLGEALTRTSQPLDAGNLPREAIFDFFQQELFAQLKPQTRDFLLKTALLPSMTAKLAQALTGRDSSAELLRRLSANNFFVVRHQGQELTYSYHPLLREFLLAQGRMTLLPDQLTLLRRNAAAILRDAGLPEDAADLYILGGEEELLADLIQNQAPTMLGQGRQKKLLQWLEHVSADGMRRRPWLCYWNALSILPWRIQEGRVLLEEAIAQFSRQGDNDGVNMARAAILLTCLTDLGMLPTMERHFLGLITEVSLDHRFPSREVEAEVVLGLILGATFCRPDHPRARHWIERGVGLLHADIPLEQKINLGLNLLIYRIYMGHQPEAERIYLQLNTIVGHKEISDLARLQWLLLEAMHTHMIDPRPERCRKTVEHGLALAETSGIHAFDVFLLAMAAYVAVNSADHDELDRLIMRLASLVPMAPPLGTVNFYCMLCCEQLGLGNGEGALQQAWLALEALPLPRSPLPSAFLFLGLAEACIEADKWSEARSYLKQARRITTGIAGFKGDVLFLVPVAYAAFRRGRERVGLRVLNIALARGREGGWLNAMYWRPRQLALLCAKALDAELETEYVRRLIQCHNLGPHLPDTLHSLNPPLLEIRTLGHLSILRKGVQLVPPSGASGKILTLLAAIIVLGAKDVPEERIWEYLWPETDGDKAASSLKFTLYGLRKFLGSPKAVIVKGRRLSLNPLVCGIDVFHFERACSAVETAMHDNAPIKNQIDLCLSAVALYTGDFLAQISLHWVAATRDRLKKHCMTVFARLAQLFARVGDGDGVLKTCEQALSIDPLREEFYKRLILEHLRVGRHVEAHCTLERCREVFKAETGLPPSRGLLELVEGSDRCLDPS